MKIARALLICCLIVASILIAGCGEEQETTTTSVESTATDNITEEIVAQDGDFVAVHYTGTLTDGTKFDSSHDRGQPLEFTVGAGQMISGFDKAVKGMKVGDTKTVNLAPEEAYGPVRNDLLIQFSRAELPEGMENPQVGQMIPLSVQGGGYVQKPIVEVTDTYIVVDANHELAGKELIFEIEMVDIQRG